MKTIYDDENLVIDIGNNYEGTLSLRISYFKDGHWTGESWVDNVFSREDASFNKDV